MTVDPKHLKSILISLVGLVIAVGPQWLGAMDFGQWTPIVQAVAGVAFNAVLVWYTANGGVIPKGGNAEPVEGHTTTDSSEQIVESVAALKAALAAQKAEADAAKKRAEIAEAAVKSLASA